MLGDVRRLCSATLVHHPLQQLQQHQQQRHQQLSSSSCRSSAATMDCATEPPVSLSEFIKHIFSITHLEPSYVVSFEEARLLLEQRVAVLRLNLSTMEATSTGAVAPEGRLGPSVVVMSNQFPRDPDGMRTSYSGLEIQSVCNFATMQANACVFAGQWMYEVTLLSDGIQQIGWSILDCAFTHEEGVGDAPDSFAYDGKRLKKWNVGNDTYGQPWAFGDVIGCAIDLEAGTISYYRNGQDMGVAFTTVRTKGPGLAYFPTLSLSYIERTLLNFGATPFRYPLEGYAPIQPFDTSSSAAVTGQYLIETCLARLLASFSNEHRETRVPLDAEDTVLLFGMIYEQLLPLLVETPFLIHSQLMPFLAGLVPSSPELIALFSRSLLQSASEYELDVIMQELLRGIGHRVLTYNQAVPIAGDFFVSHEDGTKQPLYLTLALELLSNRELLEACIDFSWFWSAFERLFSSRVPNRFDLLEAFPALGLENPPALLAQHDRVNNLEFEVTISQLTAEHQTHCQLRQKLVGLFFQCDTLRPHLRAWLHSLLSNNKGWIRNVLPPGLSDSSSLINIYFALLAHMESYLTTLDPAASFPIEYFHVSGSIFPLFDFPLLGGTANHTFQNYPLPTNHQELDKGQEYTHCHVVFHELLLLHTLQICAAFRAAAIQSQGRSQAVANLIEFERNSSQRAFGRDLSRDMVSDLERALRRCAWNRVTLFCKTKQESMWNLVDFSLKLLLHVSAQPERSFFRYIPEFYVEATTDAFHALRRGDPQFNVTTDPSREAGLSRMIDFLVLHVYDDRAINPDIREQLLQSLSLLLQYPEYIPHFERNATARERMIPNLLLDFGNRSCVPILTMLLRHWKGRDFCNVITPKFAAIGSQLYRDIFRETLMSSPAVADKFFNGLFNNINLTFSEFGVVMKEFHKLAGSRRMQVPNETMQQHSKRSQIMFDVSRSLLQMLEVVAMEAPWSILGNEMNLSRLVEILVQVVVRTLDSNQLYTAAPAAAGNPYLNSALTVIKPIFLLAPVAGILVHFHQAERNKAHETQSESADLVLERALVAVDPGFELSYFERLLALNWSSIGKDNAEKVSQDTSKLAVAIEALAKVAEQRKQHQSTSSGAEKEAAAIDEDNLCTICYTFPIDRIFAPCRHLSCHICITRHLLNSKRCFFCNAEVERVDPISPQASPSSSATPNAEKASSESSADDAVPMSEELPSSELEGGDVAPMAEETSASSESVADNATPMTEE